jgi:hypothetical protein
MLRHPRKLLPHQRVGGHCEWFGGTRFSSSHHSLTPLPLPLLTPSCCCQNMLGILSSTPRGAQVKDGDSSFLTQQTTKTDPPPPTPLSQCCWLAGCCQNMLGILSSTPRGAQVKDGDSSFITQQQQQTGITFPVVGGETDTQRRRLTG